jgi:hypothetical protein
MTIYKYSIFAKIVYRYANIAITIFLLFYVIASLMMAFQKWTYIFVSLVNLLIIFYLNRYYIRSYRIFPFKIVADSQKLICSNFFLSKKSIEIEIQNIDRISGGFFTGWPTRPIYLHDCKKNVTIGFYVHTGSFKKLLKTILENIPQNLYEELLSGLKALQGQK